MSPEYLKERLNKLHEDYTAKIGSASTYRKATMLIKEWREQELKIVKQFLMEERDV